MKKRTEKTPAEKTEAFLSRTAATYAELADSQASTLIGQVVLEMVQAGEEISRSAILAALKQRAEQAPSKHGNGTARLDIALITAEAAIRKISPDVT